MEEDLQQQKPSNEIWWNSPEYAFHHKTIDWFWWFGLATVVLIGLAVYLHNILFAFIILIGAFSMLLYAIRPPRTMEYHVSKRGFYIGEKHYPYKKIIAFCINRHYDTRKETFLLFKIKSTAEPILVIPLENIDIDELRDYLLDFIEEREIDRPIGQIFMETIGF